MVGNRMRVATESRAVSALRNGRPIVIGSAAGCELVILASAASTEAASFLIRYGSGFVVAVVSGERLAHLNVPAMASNSGGPGFHVAVDAAEGITTGISARDRARTLRIIADPQSRPADLIRPGHVMPVRVDLYRSLSADDPYQAAAMVCEVAGGVDAPAAVVALEAESGYDTVGLADGREFATRHGLAYLTTDDATGMWHRCFAVGLESLVVG